MIWNKYRGTLPIWKNGIGMFNSFASTTPTRNCSSSSTATSSSWSRRSTSRSDHSTENRKQIKIERLCAQQLLFSDSDQVGGSCRWCRAAEVFKVKASNHCACVNGLMHNLGFLALCRWDKVSLAHVVFAVSAVTVHNRTCWRCKCRRCGSCYALAAPCRGCCCCDDLCVNVV